MQIFVLDLTAICTCTFAVTKLLSARPYIPASGNSAIRDYIYVHVHVDIWTMRIPRFFFFFSFFYLGECDSHGPMKNTGFVH